MRRWALVATGLGLAACSHGPTHVIGKSTVHPVLPSVPAVATSPDAASASAEGRRLVGFGPIEVSVPASWSDNAQTCGRPTADTVIITAADGAEPTCAATGPSPKVDVLFIDSTSSSSRGAIGPMKDGRFRHTRTFIAQGVRLTTQTNVEATGQAVLASARVVATDPHGCATQVDATPKPSSGGVAGADTALLPPTPTGVVVCRYAHGILQRSAAAPAALLTAVAAAPEGTSLVPAGTQRCGAVDAYVLQASYGGGGTVHVVVHLSGCGPLYLSNGSHVSRITADVARALTGVVGSTEGFVAPSTLTDGDVHGHPVG